MLVAIEEKKKMNTIISETLAVGIARAGSNKPTLKADFVAELLKYDFGEPPQSLIFPGQLHFMEVEALIAFAEAPEKLRRMAK